MLHFRARWDKDILPFDRLLNVWWFGGCSHQEVKAGTILLV